MNEELFNEASKSNILSKQLVDQLQESMTYSSISFINWTIEVLKLLKAQGLKIKAWMKPLFCYFVPVGILFIYIYGMFTFPWH